MAMQNIQMKRNSAAALTFSETVHWMARNFRFLPLFRTITLGINTSTAICDRDRVAIPIAVSCLAITSEIQRQPCRQRSRSHVVGSAERREKVVERVFIGDVDCRQVEVQLVALAVEDIVLTDRHVKEIAWRDALWITVIVARVWSWNLDEARAELRYRTNRRQWRCGSCPDSIAHETGLEFLSGGQGQWNAVGCRTRRNARVHHGNSGRTVRQRCRAVAAR